MQLKNRRYLCKLCHVSIHGHREKSKQLALATSYIKLASCKFEEVPIWMLSSRKSNLMLSACPIFVLGNVAYIGVAQLGDIHSSIQVFFLSLSTYSKA